MMLAYSFLDHPMFVILNLFQDNKLCLPVMLKQVQHDEVLKL